MNTRSRHRHQQPWFRRPRQPLNEMSGPDLALALAVTVVPIVVGLAGLVRGHFLQALVLLPGLAVLALAVVHIRRPVAYRRDR